ncbi:MAG: hypothetical protein IKO47_08630 [Ruminococcus sp.]|nr:hypothetical protein [Ruminococcus sp.]
MKNDTLRNIEAELKATNRKLDTTNRLLNILIKKVSNASTPRQPWLPQDRLKEANELSSENPEVYDYICEVLKLFF